MGLFNDKVRIRFRCGANRSRDKIYIDEVAFSGYLVPTSQTPFSLINVPSLSAKPPQSKNNNKTKKTKTFSPIPQTKKKNNNKNKKTIATKKTIVTKKKNVAKKTVVMKKRRIN